MHISGFQKTTLLDYPDHLAATVFLSGCNFRCPYCHNSSLLPINPLDNEDNTDEILCTLKKRSHLLEGVCVTGGEPTLSADLPDFLRKIHDLGLLVKLDTNGYHPDTLAHLMEDRLVDYVAMDIKSSRETYSAACGLPSIDISRIEQSVALLLSGVISYEFRTTYVKELHTEEDVRRIGEWLADADAYYLQSYRESKDVLTKGYSAFSSEQFMKFLHILKETIPNAALRGIDL
jgi:pyruvate formate lyase activating enzyme